MEQIARSATQETWVYRDTKFGASLRSVLAAGDVKSLALPTRAG
ncbi:MAG TPA: hypothetical protein VK776_09220 [Bryobacteraceae bacterium]|nr:hypothetical protein [Bryobacteraceae bacterium]